MDQNEIDYNRHIFANENNVSLDEVEVIPKKQLIIGQTYAGNCRNASSAIWKGNHFEYQRYKFGSYYTESIKHFEDDDGYDVFIPMTIKCK